MLHEILLSLSGHPSPLLRLDAPQSQAFPGITPPERQLLASAAHLSDVHVKLITYTAQVASAHPSAICRAVATAIQTTHLSAFQRKVLEVEESILKNDPDWVGAYNIVPLTAVMGEFKQWTRRMDWLWDVVQFMTRRDSGKPCEGAQVMDRLREELHSGYQDVADASLSLVTAAETAWLKQVSAWILYGRLPTLCANDFFVQPTSDSAGEDYALSTALLPSFVAPAAASSMLFIGKALNHARVRDSVESSASGLGYMSLNLRQLSNLSFPINSAAFSRAILSVRLSLAENTLQKILPLFKVIDILQLLRDFFLLGRGEFAMALTHEADDKIRNRWRRAGNLAYEKGDDLKGLTVKEGEVSAVLARTWGVLTSMQGQHGDEDEQLEQARDVLGLQLLKSKPLMTVGTGPGLSVADASMLASSPFRNLLFSVPTTLSIQLPPPLDMVISPSDLQLYSCINAYLQSMRRAHIRLTDLWKFTSLRRHHPAPRGGEEHASLLRRRWNERALYMRSSWTTASAAIFFLGETEAYMQTEIVSELWDGFRLWLTHHRSDKGTGRSGAATPATRPATRDASTYLDEGTLRSGRTRPNVSLSEFSDPTLRAHDPQSLSTAHTVYLRTLIHRLLLTQSRFSQALYTLLVHIDHFVVHVRRLHSIFVSLDLESDAGVVDAFVDLEKEEREVMTLLRGIEQKVKAGIEEAIASLHELENDPQFLAEWQGEGGASHEDDFVGENEKYTPARVGGVNRLLMKLEFGSWFGHGTDE